MGKKKEDKKKKESVRQEIDLLTDSLDFEPINFHEIKARIRYLMSIEGKRK